jgi:small subunit ribosomal protein S2e
VQVYASSCPQRHWYCFSSCAQEAADIAHIDNCYTLARVRSCTATLGNFTTDIFDAISKTYSYLTPDLWKQIMFNSMTRL